MRRTNPRRWIAPTLIVVGATASCTALWLRLGSASADTRPATPAAPAAPVQRAATPAAPDRQEMKAVAAPVLPDRARETPDLTQTDPEMALPGGGNSFCGPVAISNSLMYLGKHGFERLVPAGDSEKAQQIALVRAISSARFMGTGPRSGTGAVGVMIGLRRYVRQAGYQIESMGYEGWRQHPYEYTRHQPRATVQWIASGLGPRSAAFVNVGWYKKDRFANAWKRNGGHWLSVVAAGVDEHGAPDPDSLVLHDPAPYEDAGPVDVFARGELLDGGWMFDGGSAFPAKGYVKLGGGMFVKREGEIAIIDGAIVVTLSASAPRP